MEEVKDTETVETPEVKEDVKEEVTEEVKPTETVEKEPSRNEILRELSKEVGVNLFETDGVKQLKTLVDSQKTKQQKMQEKIETHENEKAEWQSTKTEYEAKLKASELGIQSDYLEDALKLAEGNPDNLAEVVKKYPVFKSSKGISIGRQDPQNNQAPRGSTEAEQYMAERAKTNPEYAKYLKNKN